MSSRELVEEGIYKIGADDNTQYQAIVSIRVNGRRFYKQDTFSNITQARNAKKKLYAELLERSKIDPSPSFESFVQQFLKEVELSGRWGPNTLYRRSSIINCHFLEKFGKVPLSQISSQVLCDHFKEITDGKAHGSKRELYKTIKAIFERAFELELISRNPILGLPKPRRNKDDEREPKVLRQDQVVVLLEVLREHHFELFYHAALAVHTLARAGELRALKWSDVDFNGRYIHIWKTLDPKTGLKLKPKGKESRKVWINDELMTLLSELRVLTFSSPDDPVLPYWREFAQNEQGKPLKIFCKNLGFPLIRFHDLRATGITILLNNGIPLPTVMKLAGHKRLTTTEIYTRLAGVEVQGATSGVSYLKKKEGQDA